MDMNTHFSSCSFKHIKKRASPNCAQHGDLWENAKCNAGKLLTSPSEGHMIRLSDAKMPTAWLTVSC